MKVVCTNLDGMHDALTLETDGWLTLGREYIVLEVHGRGPELKFRILGDDGLTPALQSAERLTIIASDIPANWTFRLHPGAEWTIGPAAWADDGFWVRYFDGEPSARLAFETVARALGARNKAG